MPIKGKYFPSQISGERVFLLIRRHWIILASMILLVVVLLVPIVVLFIYWLSNPDIFSGAIGNFAVVFGGIYILAVLGLLLYGFVNYYLDVYIVTNKRIVDIKQNGFFKREIAELHLHQVQDVEARVDGFLQTVMHFGNIYVQTAGERENFVFEDVPHPYTIAKEIVELHEAQIESEYEPQMHHDGRAVDDYRPEDYFQSESPGPSGNISAQMPGVADEFRNESESETNHLDEKSEQATGKNTSTAPSSENIARQETEEKKLDEEINFGAENPAEVKKFEQDVKEFYEGEEVSVDDRDREI